MKQNEKTIEVLCLIVAGAVVLDWRRNLFLKHAWLRELASVAAAAAAILLAWCFGKHLGLWLGGGA